tara:strand:+ start:306 stop:1067 length:762 start_codon:yes stop_codon:yes gene_type:complete
MPVTNFTFGPHGNLNCPDYSYTCSNEDCNNSYSGNLQGNCLCESPQLVRDCNCECGDPFGQISPSQFFAFLTDCGCHTGTPDHDGVCPEDCPFTDETYCNFYSDSINDCSEIDEGIGGADIPKPSIQQRWMFVVNNFSPLDITLPDNVIDMVFDSSNIFYANLIVDGVENPSNYRLYGVINDEVRGIADMTTSSIPYYYLEVKWQQTQDLGEQINFYVKNTDTNLFYTVDYIENPAGESIDIETLITSLSWYG